MANHVARLKHDLGKYVALRQRWLAEDAPIAERRAALFDDLLATRRSPNGIQDAVSVWQELRPALVGEVEVCGGWRVDLRQDPDLATVEDAMGTLAEVIAALRTGEVDVSIVERGEFEAVRVSEACRALDRRVRCAKGMA